VLLDARSMPPDALIETDLCIVGAGPAGQTVARALAGHGPRICLVESGGRSPDAATQLLSAGRNVGRSYFRLRDARRRGFGGSSAHWDIPIGGGARGARLHPLERIDFEARDWLPYSGWPLNRAQLDPYYTRAATLCHVRPEALGGDGCELGGERLPLDPELVRTAVFQIGPSEVWWGERALAGLDRAGVTVLEHGTVIEIEAGPQARRVTGARVATLTGRQLRVAAKTVVLAAGGIENARLLLLSDRVQRRGLGNDRDLVGRFFMEHPYLRAGVLAAPARLVRETGLYTVHRADGTWAEGRLALADAVVRRERLYGCGVRLCVPPGAGATPVASDGPAASATSAALEVMAEQAPNPDSRVLLDRRRRDALGQRRACLDWRVSQQDVAMIARTLRLIGGHLEACGLGRFHALGHDGLPPAQLSGGRHHMGTTRMHADPAKGVVDANCRAHGIENFYVTGSSVFSTGGYANPTLTVVALALRLADHLARRFSA
jgi:choline dehydrogenase-like flavoprotein